MSSFKISLNNFQVKIVITTGGTVGLAKGIIDNSCLVYIVSQKVTNREERYNKQWENSYFPSYMLH